MFRFSSGSEFQKTSNLVNLANLLGPCAIADSFALLQIHLRRCPIRLFFPMLFCHDAIVKCFNDDLPMLCIRIVGCRLAHAIIRPGFIPKVET